MTVKRERWEWYNGCSWWRLGIRGDQMRHDAILCPTIDRDGHPNLAVSQEHRDMIERLPETLDELDELRAEVERLRREVERLQGGVMLASKAAGDERLEANRLRASLRGLREAAKRVVEETRGLYDNGIGSQPPSLGSLDALAKLAEGE